MRDLEEFPWMTLLMVFMVTTAMIVGAIVVIWGPEGALSFEDYLKYMVGFAGAVAALGVGRSVRKGLERMNETTTDRTTRRARRRRS